MVSATHDQGNLCLEVTVDGPGFPPGQAPPLFGIGLANTAARLQELYGDAYEFEFTNALSGGACVRLSIPLERTPGDAAS